MILSNWKLVKAIVKQDDIIDFFYLYSLNPFLLHCSNTSDRAISEIKYTDRV